MATNDTTVACDGGNAFGHPRVYIEYNNEGIAKCPYCSAVYRKNEAIAAKQTPAFQLNT